MNNEKVEINMPTAPGIVFINGEPYKTEWVAEAVLVEENMALRAELDSLKRQNDILRAESETMHRGVEVEFVDGEIKQITVGDVVFAPRYHVSESLNDRIAVLEQRVRDADGAIARRDASLSAERKAVQELHRKLRQAETDYKGARDEVKRLRDQLKQDRNAIRVELLDELHKQARAKLIVETPIFRG